MMLLLTLSLTRTLFIVYSAGQTRYNGAMKEKPLRLLLVGFGHVAQEMAAMACTRPADSSRNQDAIYGPTTKLTAVTSSSLIFEPGFREGFDCNGKGKATRYIME